MANPVEEWKAQKHGLDVWPDVLRFAAQRTPMRDIDSADLERMKWHGVFYRKRDASGTYMLRIRLTGCELSSEQAKEIAYVAYEYGYGIVDVTTRGNVQVQGLAIENVPRAIERLGAVGLTAKQTGHDNIRNVFGHPLSGLLPDELIDTRDLCRDITALFVDDRTYSDLPRKFNIALSGHSTHALHYWSQDLSFLACRTPDGEALFQVLIAGTQGQNPRLGVHLPVLVAPEQVVDVTRVLLDLFREKGSREKRNQARFRYLVEEIGVGGVLDYLESRLPYRLRPSISEPQPPCGYEELVGWFRQHDRRWAMGLCVPLGRLTWQQLEGLAVAAAKWGDGRLRTTHEQGIAVVNIASGFKDAAATDAAALGLSLHADPLVLNTVACTGIQFCNIAVTETKGHMFRLIEKLRQRALMLHGIRIHMSGCPSSCAQHFTADIGLKGVRVRRLVGTREGFDVYLGGGVAGQVHLGIPYKLGVDVDQLPQLVEDVVREYYLRHKAGQTFSAYWREKLRHQTEAAKVEDGEYTPPTWLCENCEYRHRGEDPPVFCPGCAGLRRHFVRLDADVERSEAAAEPEAPARDDGFVPAANEGDLSDSEGLAVEIAGREIALFRIDGTIHALDNACPHEGAPLAQGEVHDGVITCPWHGWTFNGCTGCSLDPAGHDVRTYETKVEDGKVYLKAGFAPRQASPEATRSVAAGRSHPERGNERKPAPQPVTAAMRLIEIIDETLDTKTFRLEMAGTGFPRHLPGQFAKVCVEIDGREVWRSFTISSSPMQDAWLDLTIKRNPAGEVSNYLHEAVRAGDRLTIKGPQGGFYFSASSHTEPLVLVSAGSGITPMMSILRFLIDTQNPLPCTFLTGARTVADVIFADECVRLAQAHPRQLRYFVSLTQPSPDWPGYSGRIDLEHLREMVRDLAGSRFFLCGPGTFMDQLTADLRSAGVPADRIHTEQFHKSATVAVTA